MPQFDVNDQDFCTFGWDLPSQAHLPKAPPQAAEMACQRIITGFQETSHEVGPDQHITVTISLGYATLSKETPYSTVQELLKDADEAVYYSKTHGGNQATFASNMKVNQPA